MKRSLEQKLSQPIGELLLKKTAIRRSPAQSKRGGIIEVLTHAEAEMQPGC